MINFNVARCPLSVYMLKRQSESLVEIFVNVDINTLIHSYSVVIALLYRYRCYSVIKALLYRCFIVVNHCYSVVIALLYRCYSVVIALLSGVIALFSIVIALLSVVKALL